MRLVAGSELFDVIASEKCHHLLMPPLKWHRRLCSVGEKERGTLVGRGADELTTQKIPPHPHWQHELFVVDPAPN